MRDRHDANRFLAHFLPRYNARNTVTLGPHHVQILPDGARSYAKARVELHERLDGSIAIYKITEPLGGQNY